ncbi:FkbM family methyltransferase [Allorhodopirellula heiligendammensis]|uniref:Methyltransferase domain protein n=1 Tax=Allorhodopirellula heiligendammensis TaxID=2714739 RepID=A0A5C6BZ79_9BACT|nr:FkbM family methyltransferase [Allorhodopirellula heiligendammensis]TWU16997.1 Methyltransferase domain protein [Allorhodopirellula heiligendammensis]
MIRTLIERWGRGKIVRRRLPKAFGRRSIHVSPDAALKYLFPNLERGDPSLLRIATTLSTAQSIWDIGANVGLFTFAAAHRVGSPGKVLAVEADPFLADLLQRSAQMPSNSDLNVRVLCCAASDETSVARFLIANRGRASNSLEQSGHRTQAGGTRYAQYVPTLKLDDLVETFGVPDFIKVDVEGAEMQVLRGAQHILSVHRPSFYIEVSGAQSEHVAAVFSANKYVLFDGDAVDPIRIDSCRFNTLAIPAERACGLDDTTTT